MEQKNFDGPSPDIHEVSGSGGQFTSPRIYEYSITLTADAYDIDNSMNAERMAKV